MKTKRILHVFRSDESYMLRVHYLRAEVYLHSSGFHCAAGKYGLKRRLYKQLANIPASIREKPSSVVLAHLLPDAELTLAVKNSL